MEDLREKTVQRWMDETLKIAKKVNMQLVDEIDKSGIPPEIILDICRAILLASCESLLDFADQDPKLKAHYRDLVTSTFENIQEEMKELLNDNNDNTDLN